MNVADDQLPPLIVALMREDAYDHPVGDLQLVETHISWVILTGPYAYKIKKPVDLGFVDFSTLEKRRFYCEEEVRLNVRLAPDIYLGVVPISGPQEAARIEAEERDHPLEYAVKMTQFNRDSELDHALSQGELTPERLEAFAQLIASFHQKIDRADNASEHGDCEHLSRPVMENFLQIRKRVSDLPSIATLDKLETWSRNQIDQLKPLFEQRKAQGYIRECHGDLHLRNMAWVDGKPLIFDCIEFDPNLRWIDVISEIAFLVMDLEERRQPQLAYRFLNAYLECSGDYSGLRVLNFYLVYRVLVRAKVEAIRVSQSDRNSETKAAAERAFQEYLSLAVRYIQGRNLRIIVTHGLSGSGKSTVARELVGPLRAIRIRSDVERKRMFGLTPEDNGQEAIGQDIYSEEASRKTYGKLVELANAALEGGYPVIIDATCLKADQRAGFQTLAAAKQTPYILLKITASKATLRNRIEHRKNGPSDANLEVLERQMTALEEFRPEETPHVVYVNTESPPDFDSLAEQIERI